jgi:hypothetical protein
MKHGNFTVKRILRNAGVILLMLAAVVMLPLASPVEAHMPGANPPPEFELEPIVISDGGIEIEITIEDVGNYHNETMKEFKTKMLKEKGKTEEEVAKTIEKEFAGATGICPCSSCAFRAASLGISRVWGDEIPERSDIKIISARPSPGAIQCLQYITGTGPKVPNVTNKGELHLILPDGTQVIDLSPPSLNKNMKKAMTIENWNFIIIRKSTGEQFEVQAVEDIFPEGFGELRAKVKVEGTATPAETAEFRAMWEEVRDAFLTQPDWELFEGVEEPEEPVPVGAIVFSGALVVFVVTGFIYSARGKRNK